MQAHEIQIHNQEEWDSLVLKSPIPVIVDFWANWCPPCKKVKPILDEAAKTSEGEWKLAVVDVDQADVAALAGQYGSQGIPSIYLFKKSTDKSTLNESQSQVLGYDPMKIKILIETAGPEKAKRERAEKETAEREKAAKAQPQ